MAAEVRANSGVFGALTERIILDMQHDSDQFNQVTLEEAST
jgi:hypothetical protein